jgi:hypothetical protein
MKFRGPCGPVRYGRGMHFGVLYYSIYVPWPCAAPVVSASKVLQAFSHEILGGYCIGGVFASFNQLHAGSDGVSE